LKRADALVGALVWRNHRRAAKKRARAIQYARPPLTAKAAPSNRHFRKPFLSLTPGPPPLSAINSTPAVSRASDHLRDSRRRIGCAAPVSNRLTVGSDRPAACASRGCVQPGRLRAARI
jgi:hypothetical protein